MYTIGKLAQAANIGVETIRFYEKKKLIKQPKKPPKGYRLYSEETLASIIFIKRSQQLGFSLAEISTLISLSKGNCTDIQGLAEIKLSMIREKIKDLKRLEKSLKLLIVECEENTDKNQCPIIKSLVPSKKT